MKYVPFKSTFHLHLAKFDEELNKTSYGARCDVLQLQRRGDGMGGRDLGGDEALGFQVPLSIIGEELDPAFLRGIDLDRVASEPHQAFPCAQPALRVGPSFPFQSPRFEVELAGIG